MRAAGAAAIDDVVRELKGPAGRCMLHRIPVTVDWPSMWFPEPPDLLSSLSPADRVIAELKALLGPPVAKAVFPEIVRAVSTTTPDGKVWSIQKVNESVERLVQKRVLGADCAIAPAWCDALTLRVIGRPDGAALAKAVHAAAPKSWREQNPYMHWRAGSLHTDVDLARSVRLMALSNDAAGAERLIGAAEREAAEEGGHLAIGRCCCAAVRLTSASSTT
jgi:hypothetical protein